MTADRTTATNELADEIANYGSLIERGQLTQPRKIGRELKQIATALRAAANPTEVEQVAWQSKHKVHSGIWRHCDYPHSNPEFEYRPVFTSPSPGKAGDVLAALESIHNWLVCHPIASAEDMAQSFPTMEEIARRALAVSPHDGGAV